MSLEKGGLPRKFAMFYNYCRMKLAFLLTVFVFGSCSFRTLAVVFVSGILILLLLGGGGGGGEEEAEGRGDKIYISVPNTL